MKCAYCGTNIALFDENCKKCGAPKPNVSKEVPRVSAQEDADEWIADQKVVTERTQFPIKDRCRVCDSTVMVEYADLKRVNDETHWVCSVCNSDNPIDVDYITKHSVRNKFRLAFDDALGIIFFGTVLFGGVAILLSLR